MWNRFFEDFFRKIYERKKKNQWKSCHPLFRVHRVNGIQNNCHILTINNFLTVWKTKHCSKIYLQIGKPRKNISCIDALFFKPPKTRKSWDQDSCFEDHKPWTQKRSEIFFTDILFFTLRFFVKNLRKFISHMGYPQGIYKPNHKVKKVKKILLGKIWPPSHLLFLEWSYCIFLTGADGFP